MTKSRQIQRKRASGLFAMPSTAVGRWSAWLLLVALALVLLNSLVLMPVTEARAGLELVQNASNLLVGVCVISSGLAGLYAVVAQRERSWVAGVAILVLIVVVALMFQDITTVI